MNSNGSRILKECVSELRDLISELKSVRDSVKYDFVNIGNDKCAESLSYVIERYEEARKKLEAIDPGVIDEMEREKEMQNSSTTSYA